ncbi:MAG: hypothetical protein PVJ86_07350 [Phycisphaerales bacterium]|jgi:hypothetical protein
MRNGSNRTDSRLDGNEIDKGANGRPSWSVGNSISNRFGLLWIFAIGVAMLVSAGPVFGQFTVQPMMMEIQIRPGKIVKSGLDIVNLDPNETHIIDLSVVELGQNEDGSWKVIESEDPNVPVDTSNLPSCSKWISFSPGTVTLAPLGAGPVTVDIRVPPRTRGFYTAGILATIRPRENIATDVTVILRFLVPVLLEVQGRTPRPKVEATDVGLQFIESRGADPSTSLVSMSIANSGGTYSKLKPVARIWAFSGDHWRVITTTEFQDVSIIPGARLKLRTPVNKRLPSGKYKVAGVLYVDGRRAKRVEKEIDFVGDTSATGVAADAPIDLDPIAVTIDSLPGATRASMIKVYNASDETVNIQTALQLPRLLQTTSFGDVKGMDLSCTEWLQVTPANFTLRGEGGQQTLRIVAAMPNPAKTYPCYYSLLHLMATYPDGQKAGTTTAKICVRDTNVEVAPEAMAMKLTPQALGDSKYLVVARFGNFGTIHFAPVTVQAAVIVPAIGMRRANTYLSGDPSLMLPFETRDFSGVMDLSYLPADMYRLAAALEYAPGQFATKQMAIRVSIEGEERIVEVMGTEKELAEIIEVKW